jgi:hypothetical protein
LPRSALHAFRFSLRPVVFPHITDAFAAPPLVPIVRYMGLN